MESKYLLVAVFIITFIVLVTMKKDRIEGFGKPVDTNTSTFKKRLAYYPTNVLNETDVVKIASQLESIPINSSILWFQGLTPNTMYMLTFNDFLQKFKSDSDGVVYIGKYDPFPYLPCNIWIHFLSVADKPVNYESVNYEVVYVERGNRCLNVPRMDLNSLPPYTLEFYNSGYKFVTK